MDVEAFLIFCKDLGVESGHYRSGAWDMKFTFAKDPSVGPSEPASEAFPTATDPLAGRPKFRPQ